MTCEVHELDGSQGGTFRITTTLSDANGGTDLVAVHEGLPAGVSTADNEVESRQALGRLTALVEAG